MDEAYPITILERDQFPITLRQMKSPPQRLFMRGCIDPGGNDRKYLCVVGSRQWSGYGRDCVSSLINGLAGYPISIVSGLAIGIDSYSHIAALETGLHCVAFPGSTLDWPNIYPRSHIGLARSITEAGGALISAWNPGYPTADWSFPARNRLMAGLCHAVLIVEASRGSGSLMTAGYAVDFNRDVMAIPGHITAPNSYGTHMLIQRGAALVASSYDILVGLGFNPPKHTKGQSLTDNDARPSFIPSNVKEDKVAMKMVHALNLENLNFDELLYKVKCSVPELNVKLSILELAGLIENVGGVFRRKR